MESAVITKSFEGVPITLVAASIVSLAFMGFSGMGA
jgi:Na+-translocating ferredoxin:NAD+ oxidoreductase RnfA subunit